MVVATSLSLPRSSGPFEEMDATWQIITAFWEFYGWGTWVHETASG